MAPTSLFAPRTWCLQPGAVGAPVVRFLGALMLLALACLTGAWLLAIGQDVWRGGRSAWVLLACAPVAWWSVHQLRSAWLRWHTVPPILTLTWAGEVQSDPPAGGWRLGGLNNGAPAEVRCLLDAQGWLLCRIQAVGEGESAAAVHWCWIHARCCPDMHRFRTLMSLPSRLTTAVGGGAEAHAPAMASWALRRHPSGIALRGSTDTFMPTQPLVAWGEAAGPAGKDPS